MLGMKKKPVQPTSNIADKRIINTIKVLGLDMIYNAKSGHPGIVLSAAPIMYTLFSKHLNFNVNDTPWLNRDRFVMSAGHGSALLYSTLYMAGYKYTLDDLKTFRKLNSRTPGHPELGLPGVEVTTGPLGQGLASAVGMAIGEKFLAERFNEKKEGMLSSPNILFDNNIYVLCSDGDMMEGISYEAASLAGTLNLGNLIVLYDSNRVSLDGLTARTFKENVLERFGAMGWETYKVSDGDDIASISKAIAKAKGTRNMPSIIEVNTILGKGSSYQGTSKVHGGPLDATDMDRVRKSLGYTQQPFAVSQKAMMDFKKHINNRVAPEYKDWTTKYKKFIESISDDEKAKFLKFAKGELTVNLKDIMWNIHSDTVEATRVSSSKVMQIVGDNIFNFVGGSADLASSVKTYLAGKGDFSPTNYGGQNVWFGVREHAMGAVLNGMALVGLRPYGGTFLTFADYLKPSIRMSAIMNLPVTYILSHDSIDIGEDGPTHQPIEQLAMLRATPNFYVYRPADAKETAGAWENILSNKKPSALVLGRNPVDVQKTTSIEGVKYGGYIVGKEESVIHAIIIATGREVITALKIKANLRQKGYDLRVVSMPCLELFLIQSDQYRQSIFPTGVRVIVIEPSSDSSWYRFIYNEKYLINLTGFGASGSRLNVLKKFGFDEASILKRVEELLK